MSQPTQNPTVFNEFHTQQATEKEKYIQREWTAGLEQITSELTEVAGSIATMGVAASLSYEQSEAQAVIDKVEEIITKVNELTAITPALVSILTEVNKIIDGLTVQ